MAKLEVSEDQLKKFMDEATQSLVKDLEKQVRNLETRLLARDRKIADLKHVISEHDDAVSTLKNVHSETSSFCEGEGCY